MIHAIMKDPQTNLYAYEYKITTFFFTIFPNSEKKSEIWLANHLMI